MRSWTSRRLGFRSTEALLLVLLLLALMPAASASMIDLGTLGLHSHALAINDAGQVVGFFETRLPTGEAGPYHAFLWEQGMMMDIGSLSGGNTIAYAINHRGQIVGSSYVGGASHAFLWERGVMIDLGTLGSDFSLAQAINDKGQVAGISDRSSGARAAFLWENGVMRDIGNLGGTWLTNVVGINAKGQVAGSSLSNSGAIHAFFWDGVMMDIGTLGCFLPAACGPGSEAHALNDIGQVVGQANMGGDGTGSSVFHAFLWENGTMRNLGTLGGNYANARAINNRGQVTGESTVASTGSIHAYLWENEEMSDLGLRPGAPSGGGSAGYAINDQGQIAGASEGHAIFWERGVMTDLGTLGGTDSNAIALNNRGQVIGDSKISTGETHAFLWEKR